MKKAMYALILPLVVVSGIVFANREMKIDNSKKSTTKQQTAAEMKTVTEECEATPGELTFEEWEASPAGKKVYAAEDKVKKAIKESSNMEAVVTSLTLPPDSRLGFGVMVRIEGEDYIVSFGPEKTYRDFLNSDHEFQQLYSLKVNDKIILKSKNVSHAPKYAYPILTGDYVEREGKVLYKRVPRQDGC